MLYDVDAPEVPLTLIVRNDGNTSLRILKADGGCSCREVDQAPFPTVVEPGERLTLSVRMHTGRLSTPQIFGFTFDTDKGSITVPIPFLALPRNQFDPESVSNGTLFEGDGWVFELTRRMIYRRGDNKPAQELRFPGEFAVSESDR